jgi:GxxExxY protein
MKNKEHAGMRFEDYELTGRIIDAIIKTHQELGPGFSIEIYRNALIVELKHQRLEAEADKPLRLHYAGEEVGVHLLDLVVEERILLGLRLVEQIEKQHYAQMRSLMHAAGMKTGLLVNYAWEKADFRRVEAS